MGSKKTAYRFMAVSPLNLRANCISLGIIVTLLAWIAHKLVSSNKETIKASLASCKAMMALLWNRRSDLYSWAISLTNLWNGSFLLCVFVLSLVRERKKERKKGRKGEFSTQSTVRRTHTQVESRTPPHAAREQNGKVQRTTQKVAVAVRLPLWAI